MFWFCSVKAVQWNVFRKICSYEHAISCFSVKKVELIFRRYTEISKVRLGQKPHSFIAKFSKIFFAKFESCYKVHNLLQNVSGITKYNSAAFFKSLWSALLFILLFCRQITLWLYKRAFLKICQLIESIRYRQM